MPPKKKVVDLLPDDDVSKAKKGKKADATAEEEKTKLAAIDRCAGRGKR